MHKCKGINLTFLDYLKIYDRLVPSDYSWIFRLFKFCAHTFEGLFKNIKLVLHSMIREEPINFTYDETPMRQTNFELDRGITCHRVRQISAYVEPYCFDMGVSTIDEVEPDQLRKVIQYYLLV